MSWWLIGNSPPFWNKGPSLWEKAMSVNIYMYFKFSHILGNVTKCRYHRILSQISSPSWDNLLPKVHQVGCCARWSSQLQRVLMPSTTLLPVPCPCLTSTKCEGPRDCWEPRSSLSQTRVDPQIQWKPEWRCGCPGRSSLRCPRCSWRCSRREGTPFQQEFRRTSPQDRCRYQTMPVGIQRKVWSTLYNNIWIHFVRCWHF